MLAIPWASKGKDELLGIYNKAEAALKYSSVYGLIQKFGSYINASLFSPPS